jgi:hypothetical protein
MHCKAVCLPFVCVLEFVDDFNKAESVADGVISPAELRGLSVVRHHEFHA